MTEAKNFKNYKRQEILRNFQAPVVTMGTASLQVFNHCWPSLVDCQM